MFVRAVLQLLRKITKIGNSLGVIIPSTFLEELKLTHKDKVEIEFDKDLKVITIRDAKTTSMDNHLDKMIKDVVDAHLKNKGL